MSSTDLYIIAAGNGSRLNASMPKALVSITSEPCLTTTLRQIGHKFRRVFVVTNVLARDQWHSYFRALEVVHPGLARFTIDLPIESGLGDGHATLQGLMAAENLRETTLSQDIVVTWGDVFFRHPELIDELLSMFLKGSGLLPVIEESNPYVSLLINEEMQCVSADFSKFGEKHVSGLHDQSVFRFARHRLRASLCDLHNALWKGGRYLSPGGELSLLHSFHQLYNSGNPTYVYETRYATLSFNTIEEVVTIQHLECTHT